MSVPEKSFRINHCAATVFHNVVRQEREDSPPLVRRHVLLQRTYLDAKNNWQTINNFRLSDLPAAISVLQMALEYVASQEAVVEG